MNAAFLFEYFESNNCPQRLKICEFGGAGGNLLAELNRKIGERATLINAELVEKYRDYQVCDSIEFIRASILDSGFENGAFDVVIARNILHHLIGKSLASTRANQEAAVSELFRVTKPGGLVLIEEQVNQSPLACLALYHMSRFASRMEFRSKLYMVTPYTIVGYLTQRKLEAICRKARPGIKWLSNDYLRWKIGLHWKVVFLLNNTGPVFFAIEKPGG